jgi:hypothetical protein
MDADTWSIAEQKALYRAVRRLVGQRVWLGNKPNKNGRMSRAPAEGVLTLDWFYADALGIVARRSGSEDNFRAGRMSKKLAADAYKWLEKNFPDEARVVANEIARTYGNSTQGTWETFLREHGEFGKLTLSVSQRRRFSVRRLDPEEEEERDLVSATVPLHYPFSFSIKGGEGFFLALQWVRGRWSAIPLASDKLSCVVEPDDSGEIRDVRLHEPNLVEDSEPGLHRFVLLQTPPDTGAAIEKQLRGDMPIAESVLNEIVRLLRMRSQTLWTLHRLNAMFVLTDLYLRHREPWEDEN